MIAQKTEDIPDGVDREKDTAYANLKTKGTKNEETAPKVRPKSNDWRSVGRRNCDARGSETVFSFFYKYTTDC